MIYGVWIQLEPLGCLAGSYVPFIHNIVVTYTA
jgi:hypothetical protein